MTKVNLITLGLSQSNEFRLVKFKKFRHFKKRCVVYFSGCLENPLLPTGESLAVEVQSLPSYTAQGCYRLCTKEDFIVTIHFLSMFLFHLVNLVNYQFKAEAITELETCVPSMFLPFSYILNSKVPWFCGTSCYIFLLELSCTFSSASAFRSLVIRCMECVSNNKSLFRVWEREGLCLCSVTYPPPN